MRSVKPKVTAKSRTKALMGNYKRCTKKLIHPNIKFIMTEQVDVWYFIIGVNPQGTGGFDGDNEEFKEGQFIGKITASKDYPYSPPMVIMLTPTNVFPLNNSNFCIDIGHYHKNNYPPSLGLDGFVKMIWSGLIGWNELGHGINLLHSRKKKKERIVLIGAASAMSQAYNQQHHADILQMFVN